MAVGEDMKKYIRKTLDWAELPKTLYLFLLMNEEQIKNAKVNMDKWVPEWRKNTVPFKIARCFINLKID